MEGLARDLCGHFSLGLVLGNNALSIGLVARIAFHIGETGRYKVIFEYADSMPQLPQ